MDDQSLALLGDIPRFSDLSFAPCPEDHLLQLTKDIQALISQEKGGEEAARSLLSFQQILLNQQSQVNYQRICQALQGEQAESSQALPADADTSLPFSQAKATVYRAIANYPYEAMEGSAEDMDLWSRAWRWSRFEELIPASVWDRERKLVQALQGLNPSLLSLWQEVNQSAFPPDAQAAHEDRVVFFQALLQQLKQEGPERSKLCLELLTLRQQIAKTTGFAHYSDYHEARRGKRSFGRKAELNFLQNFRSHFLPIWQEFKRQKDYRLGIGLDPWLDYFALSQYGQVPLVLEGSDLRDQFIASLASLTGHPQHFLLSLMDKGYISHDSFVRDRLGTPSSLLMSVPASFLALPLDGKRPLTQSFLDTGYALADISAMLNYHSLGSSRQDAYSKQLSAYIFLVLARRELAKYYGENADLAWDMAWAQQLQLSFLYGFFYMWENRLYHMSGRLDPLRMRQAFQKILTNQLGFLDLPQFSDESLDLLWPYVFAYNLEAYQSLAPVLSLVTILALHPQHLSPSLLSSKLNNFLLTNPGGAILDRLQEASLPDPFSQVSLQKASFSLCDLLAL